MRFLNVTVFILCITCVWSTELYSSRYDSLDIEGILGSDRLVNNYVECLLNKRPCTPEGKSLKRVLPEALKSKCQRCSLKQKESALKVIRRLHDAYPEKWLELAERYDPTGDYRKSYEEYLRNEQYNIIDGAEPASNSVQGNVPVLPEIGTRFNFEETKPIEKPNVQEFNKPSNNVNNDHKSAPPVRSVSNGASGPNANTLPPATEKAPPPPPPPAPSTTYTPIIVQNNPSTTRSTIFTIQGNFQARPLSSQVLGIVSNLGNKVARTAGIITGMLKDTVHVIVG